MTETETCDTNILNDVKRVKGGNMLSKPTKKYFTEDMKVRLTPAQVKSYITTKKRSHNNFNIRINQKSSLEEMLKVSEMIVSNFDNFTITVLDENDNFPEPVLTCDKEGVSGFMY